MTEFYAPATKKITLPSGRSFQLRKGIHHLPADLVDDPSANTLGIKPVEEMTDAEWQALALDKTAWMKARDAKLQAEKDAKAAADKAAADAKTSADIDALAKAAPAVAVTSSGSGAAPTPPPSPSAPTSTAKVS